ILKTVPMPVVMSSSQGIRSSGGKVAGYRNSTTWPASQSSLHRAFRLGIGKKSAPQTGCPRRRGACNIWLQELGGQVGELGALAFLERHVGIGVLPLHPVHQEG